LDYLKQLPHLRRLEFIEALGIPQKYPNIDANLMDIEGLLQLQYLDLENVQVTDEGVKKLQQALPTCKIIAYPPTPPTR